jgi:hypothetical protein
LQVVVDMTCLVEVAPAFGFVLAKGLLPRARDDVAKATTVGNLAMVLVGTPFSLRIERDNDQMFVHAGSNSLGWHRLEHVLAFIDSELAPPPSSEPAGMEVLARLLELQWEAVGRVFRTRERVAALESFALRRSAIVLQEYFCRPLA